MPHKRPPDREEDNLDGPPPKNPTLTHSMSNQDQLLSDLTALAGRSSQPNEALLQSIIMMMTTFMETIKELRQEIRELKDSRSTPQPPPSTQPTNHATPIRPNAWVNPYPKQTQTAMPKPPPKNSEINKFKAATLIIHKTPGLEPFKGLSNIDIVKRINDALRSIDAKANGQQVFIRSASILKSGDVLMNMDNRFMKVWLLEHKHQWTKLAHNDFITSQTRYPILFNYVPADLEVEKEDFPQKLSEQNDIPIELIHSVKWLKDPRDTGKNHGTIVLNLLDKDLAFKIGKGGLYADCNRLKSKQYVQGPTMCFNCLDLYHTHNSCNNYAYCSKCGDPHNTKDCANNDADQVCARCFHFDCQKSKEKVDRFSPKYTHSPKSLSCPLRNTKFVISPTDDIDNDC